MKKLLFILFLAFSATTFAQTGIGTTTPNASAQLDVTSTTKGFLPPRMTAAQRDAISNPAAGLVVYVTDGTAGLYEYSSGNWNRIILAADLGGKVNKSVTTMTLNTEYNVGHYTWQPCILLIKNDNISYNLGAGMLTISYSGNTGVIYNPNGTYVTLTTSWQAVASYLQAMQNASGYVYIRNTNPSFTATFVKIN
jgi:hypothetical protein